jgi:hypothetical protein
VGTNDSCDGDDCCDGGKALFGMRTRMNKRWRVLMVSEAATLLGLFFSSYTILKDSRTMCAKILCSSVVIIFCVLKA